MKQIDLETGDVIKIHKCQKYAAIELGINRGHIGSVCKGNRKSTGGFGWEYVEPFEKNVKPKCENRGYHQLKPVHMLDVDGNILETYASIKEAAEKNNCVANRITLCVTGRAKTYMNRGWSYVT